MPYTLGGALTAGQDSGWIPCHDTTRTCVVSLHSGSGCTTTLSVTVDNAAAVAAGTPKSWTLATAAATVSSGTELPRAVTAFKVAASGGACDWRMAR